MRSQKLYNILETFDFNLLGNPEFKEDSVREEIIVPIIKELGYTSSKPNQIIRSRSLLHPFTSIGSQKKKIYIIPDYLFEVNGQPTWILDAKSPTESIIKSKNVEQAYSYAIHNEVRVDFFALCNGKEFALYHIHKIEPILHFDLRSLPMYWESLKNILAPNKVLLKTNLNLAKDLGLHLKRLGFDEFSTLIFPNVPVTNIGQLDNNMFTISVGSTEIDGSRYVATFDFDLSILRQLVDKIPDEAIEQMLIRNEKHRNAVHFSDTAYLINIDCQVGTKLEENELEIFQPLTINKII